MIQKSNQFMLVYFTSFDCFWYIPGGGGGKKDNIILAKRRGCDLEQQKRFIWTTLSFWKDPWNSWILLLGDSPNKTNLHWIQVSWSQLHSKPNFCLTSFLSGFLLAKKTFESPLNQSDGRSGWRISPPKWPLVVFSNMLGTVFVTPNYRSALLKHILHRYIVIH